VRAELPRERGLARGSGWSEVVSFDLGRDRQRQSSVDSDMVEPVDVAQNYHFEVAQAAHGSVPADEFGLE
jgi:hypothetical protein